MASTANQASLQQSLDQVIAAYNKMTVDPRPDGSGDGSSIQWTAMRRALQEEMQKLREQILAEDAPFEVVSTPSQGF
jgi:hypothetical protein